MYLPKIFHNQGKHKSIHRFVTSVWYLQSTPGCFRARLVSFCHTLLTMELEKSTEQLEIEEEGKVNKDKCKYVRYLHPIQGCISWFKEQSKLDAVGCSLLQFSVCWVS